MYNFFNKKVNTHIEHNKIIITLIKAVQYLHKNNIIHCDIKPHNILITPDKQVKVTDFGIARAVTSATTTMTETIMGSANYFSPEQAKGGEIKEYSDLYSLGIVLYEMMTGEVPFSGDSPISVALKHIKETPKKPSSLNSDIPNNLEKLIMKALAKDPEDRFENAAEMRESITEVLQKLRNIKDKDSTIVLSDSGDTKVLKKAKIEDVAEEYAAQKEGSGKKNKPKKERITATHKPKKNWLLWIGTVMGLLAISAIALFFFYQNYMEVPVVKVPDIVGMSFEEARTVVAQVGLSLEKQNEGVYHSKVPKNNIISQTPSSGERVRQTRSVTVTISLGPAVINLPDLKGKSLRQAEIILENNKIKIGKKEFIYHDKVEKNNIIKQQPGPSQKMEADDKIDLTISKGMKPHMVSMPNLIGIPRDEALKKVSESQLKVGEIKEKITKRFKKDQVAKQEYTAGVKIAEDTKINLTISKGIENPNNKNINSLTVNVNIRGFEEKIIKIVVSDDNGRDVVYQHKHEPGDYVSQTINSVGHTIIEVYYDGELKHRKEIGG
jgi:serine/threonine-protein kinase